MVNILAYVKLYPPTTNAGAELMLHEILLELKARGHKVMVAQPEPKVRELDGIPIVDNKKIARTGFVTEIVFTQNHDTVRAIKFAKSIRRPIVHFIHNDKAVDLFRLTKDTADLIVANSRWVYETVKVPVYRLVVHPYTELAKYQVARPAADKITFVNLIPIKGVDVFWQVAEAMPTRQFLAVKGGYGKQTILRMPNVTVVDNTDDMRTIYAQTRILLVPSRYESWGRVGVEAMTSGIPVIASRTPGLRESLGSAARLVNVGDISGIVKAIELLDNASLYKAKSEKATARAKQLARKFPSQIDALEAKTIELAKAYGS